jgi:catechol 2,3-dioxygenase-like lactoylglutathione lyase family enzyme
MRISLTSVYVDDQAKAVTVYPDVLGFQKHHDVPLGDDSWRTVVSPSAPNGPELFLEPAGHPAVKPYRDALVADGIPHAQVAGDGVEAEYERLCAAGVEFTQPPTDFGTVTVAVFDDALRQPHSDRHR